MIYADHNATAPPLPEVIAAMMAALESGGGNPSSRHHLPGRTARGIVDQARAEVAALCHVRDDELIFTSGATEALNHVILGVGARLLAERPRFVALAVEHPAVTAPLRHLASLGADLQWIPVDGAGRPDLERARELIDPRTALVCAMGVNNETGVIHDVAALATLAKAQGALLLCDATQAAMRMTLDLPALGCNFAALSAHKLHGPMGVGVLWRRRGLSLSPLIHGGGQEGGWRSGTENVPGLAGFAVAARLARERLDARRIHLADLTDRLEGHLRSHLPGLRILGSETDRVPGVTCCTLPGLRRGWLAQLAEVAASAGSACGSGGGSVPGGSSAPSPVLSAMGLSPEDARNSLRISLAETNTVAEVERIAQAMVRGAERLGARERGSGDVPGVACP